MYHLIVFAVLITGNQYKYSESYYDTKADCMNEVLALPKKLQYHKDICKYIESEWFPDQDIFNQCKKDDLIQSLTGTCVE